MKIVFSGVILFGQYLSRSSEEDGDVNLYGNWTTTVLEPKSDLLILRKSSVVVSFFSSLF